MRCYPLLRAILNLNHRGIEVLYCPEILNYTFSEEKTLSDKSHISPVFMEEISNIVFGDNPTQRHY